ncbi:MAG: hypothetical protein KGI59_01020 [Patescibacteria group bacterium]|nr:hypothetical protein [Patescibacteria group bacterium]MDE2172815.1 hypothetical protein [Patescibacteria group bacterium]
MKKTYTLAAGILGVVLILLAFYYWLTPADALPHFLPGYNPIMTGPHFKHGLGAFILGLGAFVYVWFAKGAKNAGQAAVQPDKSTDDHTQA